MFIANYGQKESDRLGLDLIFAALAPRMVPDTEFGKYAVAGYSRYLGIPETDFVRSLDSPLLTSTDVAAAVDGPDGHGWRQWHGVDAGRFVVCRVNGRR